MTETIINPAPYPVDETSRGFWEAVEQGVFALEKCIECGWRSHPPVGACKRCGGDVRIDEVSGEGRIYALTRTHYQAVPTSIGTVPYTVAVVELAMQPQLRIVVPIASGHPLAIGDAVQIRIGSAPGGFALPVAVAADGAGASR